MLTSSTGFGETTGPRAQGRRRFPAAAAACRASLLFKEWSAVSTRAGVESRKFTRAGLFLSACNGLWVTPSGEVLGQHIDEVGHARQVPGGLAEGRPDRTRFQWFTPAVYTVNSNKRLGSLEE